MHELPCDTARGQQTMLAHITDATSSRAFVWELTEETIDLPLGCLQGGSAAPRKWQGDYHFFLARGKKWEEEGSRGEFSAR